MKKRGPLIFRAGKHKCSRCKVVWNRKRGYKSKICPRCKEHCSRCDVFLTKENTTSDSINKTTYWCKVCTSEWTKLFKKKNDPTGDKHRDYYLVNKYGITVNEYNAILKLQNGECYICGKIPAVGQNRLAVDHLHSKGENKRNPREKRGRVRGLLCWQCNRAIGTFKDDITKLRRAAEYLEAWPAQQVLKEKT